MNHTLTKRATENKAALLTQTRAIKEIGEGTRIVIARARSRMIFSQSARA
jgi:hypothetical protein